MATTPPWHPERLAGRRPFLDRRARLAADTRAFFAAQGVAEIETPCLVPSPGAEVHLEAFATRYVPHLGAGAARPLYLRTSPELAIKRLLAGGAGPVFELARVWRNGEQAALHAPEFTMLEWYRPGFSLAALMDETEAYLRAVAPGGLHRAGRRITLEAPFARLSMAEAFAAIGIDLLASVDAATGAGDAATLATEAERAGWPARPGEDWEALFFRLLGEAVEPRLPPDRPAFLTCWPAPQAALARRDAADPRAALRFELYAAGVELANAFEELTDPAEQRARLARDMAARAEPWPVDEDFLAALAHGMPPCSGIALGFDRLAMLVSGAPRVEDVLWLPLG
jgi:elongation factor P--(R)-beta-lysine ligase